MDQSWVNNWPQQVSKLGMKSRSSDTRNQEEVPKAVGPTYQESKRKYPRQVLLLIGVRPSSYSSCNKRSEFYVIFYSCF